VQAVLLADKGRRAISFLERITSFDNLWRFGTALATLPSMPMPIDQTDYSVVVKLRAPSTELVEVGDLSCRKIKPDRAGIGLFYHYGGSQ
jgi:hypothetical protein